MKHQFIAPAAAAILLAISASCGTTHQSAAVAPQQPQQASVTVAPTHTSETFTVPIGEEADIMDLYKDWAVFTLHINPDDPDKVDITVIPKDSEQGQRMVRHIEEDPQSIQF